MATYFTFQKGTIPLHCKINITRETLRCILEAAEEGTKHWVEKMECGEPEPGPMLSKNTPKTGITLHKAESDTPGEDMIDRFLNGAVISVKNRLPWEEAFPLKVGNLLDGIQKYLECSTPPAGDFLEWVDHELRVDNSQISDEVGDAILQYALFGSIRYTGGVQIGG